MDNHIRWNSQYTMLIVLLDLRTQVETYYVTYEDELKEDILSPKDQKKLYIIKEFLAPFTRATLFIEGDSTLIDYMLFTIDVLIKHL